MEVDTFKDETVTFHKKENTMDLKTYDLNKFK